MYHNNKYRQVVNENTLFCAAFVDDVFFVTTTTTRKATTTTTTTTYASVATMAVVLSESLYGPTMAAYHFWITIKVRATIHHRGYTLPQQWNIDVRGPYLIINAQTFSRS